ncbi:hypothetical protein [Micromonospora deserti]|uniref:Uncharacterized protein n=1 Tax=Micromonospora deserti TaxID=2070366 RepID=A0A2W2CGG8_9ACTN|nr:hypothetical protein [Micromonospora deserti]PZF92014.1 hypothetical protein C1I99_22405 [Micromonospora deserti]
MRGLIKAAAVAVVGMAVRRLVSPGGGDGRWQRGPLVRRHPRWHVVTVNRSTDDVVRGKRLPEPLAGLGEAVEIRFRRAAGDRGIELAVRLRDGDRSAVIAGIERLSGRDPDQAIRAALREAKQLLETGEVLHPDYPPTTESTAVNRPLQLATRQGRREGRL